jgi:hypothetical protein
LNASSRGAWEEAELAIKNPIRGICFADCCALIEKLTTKNKESTAKQTIVFMALFIAITHCLMTF